MSRGVNDYDAARIQGRNVSNANSYSIVSPGPVTDGLVLYLDAGNYVSYPTTGTEWVDLSIIRNNGVLTNGPTYSAQNGGSIVFDGSNDYINCGNLLAYQLATQVTVEAWVNPTNNAGQGNIIQKDQNFGYRCRITSANAFWLFSNSNSISGGSCPTGSWSHVTGVFGPAGLRAYVNGALVASNSTAYSPGGLVNSLPLEVGRYATGNEVFNGRIAIAKVYNRVLNAMEVQQNFNALRARFDV